MTMAAAVNPDSILCACACQDALWHPAAPPWQSSRKSPSRNVPAPAAARAAAPRRPSRLGRTARHRTIAKRTRRAPEALAATWL